MHLYNRLTGFFSSKSNQVLDRWEDPRASLDVAYRRQLDLLSKISRGIADIATSRKALELQATQLQRAADTLAAQAKSALALGREDLARAALVRRSALQTQLDDLSAQHNQLLTEEQKLIDARAKLQTKVNAFKTRKETLKATYSAAEAHTKLQASFSGLTKDTNDLDEAVTRIEDKTLALQARSGALDDLLTNGSLDDPYGTSRDELTLALEQLSTGADVESEMTRLRFALVTAPTASAPALKAGVDPTPA